jgi:hypothetical protein
MLIKFTEFFKIYNVKGISMIIFLDITISGNKSSVFFSFFENIYPLILFHIASNTAQIKTFSYPIPNKPIVQGKGMQTLKHSFTATNLKAVLHVLRKKKKIRHVQNELHSLTLETKHGKTPQRTNTS